MLARIDFLAFDCSQWCFPNVFVGSLFPKDPIIAALVPFKWPKSKQYGWIRWDPNAEMLFLNKIWANFKIFPEKKQLNQESKWFWRMDSLILTRTTNGGWPSTVAIMPVVICFYGYGMTAGENLVEKTYVICAQKHPNPSWTHEPLKAIAGRPSLELRIPVTNRIIKASGIPT